MTIQNIFNGLWFETWWSWQPTPNVPPSFQDLACHYFNLFEATAWFVFAVLVVRRWMRLRRSWLEPVYSLAFALFGLSDLVEAWSLTSWLLWWKLANLLVLFRLRRIVMRRYYPELRLF